jgi:hypothetical protein
MNGTALSVAVAACLLLLVASHLAVPCAGQQCAATEVMSSLSPTGTTTIVPTIAQRILIKNSAVVITNGALTVTSGAASPAPA